METNEIGLINIDSPYSVYRGNNPSWNKPNIITDPLCECAMAEWIVKDSPETVETFRETQERLEKHDQEISKYLASIRPKIKPKTILK